MPQSGQGGSVLLNSTDLWTSLAPLLTTPLSSDMVCVSSDDDWPALPVTTALSSSASRADVLALYMGEAKSLTALRVSSFAAKESSIAAKPIEYITAEGVVRLSGSGTLTKAVMRPGPDGFATAQFPGDQPRVCEMTNFALPSAVVLRTTRCTAEEFNTEEVRLCTCAWDELQIQCDVLPQDTTRLPFEGILGSEEANFSVRRHGP